MTDYPARPNQHPVDRMAELKSHIAALEREFAELRSRLLSGNISPVGDEWQANVTEHTRRSIKLADVERVLPPEIVQSLLHVSVAARVTLVRKQSNR